MALEQTLRLIAITLGALEDKGELSPIPLRTLEHLDWDEWGKAIALRTRTTLGQAWSQTVPLFNDVRCLQRHLEEVWTVMGLLQSNERIPIRDFEDLREGFQRAKRGAVLELYELQSMAHWIGLLEEVRSFLEQQSKRYTLFKEWIEDWPSFKVLKATFKGIFTEDGQLSDRASEALGVLRRRLRQKNEDIRHAIEQKAREHKDQLQDVYFTIREGRYVLPVKVHYRQQIKGIVHSSSASGQTVYIEPTELVHLNNEVRMAEFAVEAEVQRILAQLSQEIGSYGDLLSQAWERMIYMDIIQAKAQLCMDLKCERPELSHGRLALKQARHPILALRHEVVANDIVFEKGMRALVISGSNAGGKTVTLKTVGLLAVLIRAGFPLPIEEGSSMPIFDHIFTDIGDAQSIREDTSTFSAHILHLQAFLKDINHRTLVLIDEPFSGTDPMHGSALSIALLEYLHGRGALTLTTTHLDEVKAFALGQKWIGNASVGFDLDEMRPTFELHMGVPGISYAFEISQKLNFEPRILKRAHYIAMGRSDVSLKEVLDRLQEENDKLVKTRKQLEREKKDVEILKKRLEKQLERAQKQQLNALDEEAKRVKEDLRYLRRNIARQIKSLQSRKKYEHVREAHQALEGSIKKLKKLEKVEERVGRKLDKYRRPRDRKKVDKQALKIGDRVWISSYGQEGEVVEIDQNKDRVTVQMGIFKAEVKVREIYKGREEKRTLKRGSRGQRKAEVRVEMRGEGMGESQRPPILLPQTSENTCDLRGYRVDEALERLEYFLDRAYQRHLDAIYVIHGHGTGALKAAVREYLPQSHYVVDFRAGEQGEGGDGVTVTWLK